MEEEGTVFKTSSLFQIYFIRIVVISISIFCFYNYHLNPNLSLIVLIYFYPLFILVSENKIIVSENYIKIVKKRLFNFFDINKTYFFKDVKSINIPKSRMYYFRRNIISSIFLYPILYLINNKDDIFAIELKNNVTYRFFTFSNDINIDALTKLINQNIEKANNTTS